MTMPILDEFKTYYHSSMNQEYPDAEPGTDKLRVSGLPYCGVRHVWTRCHRLPGIKSPAASYFGGVGIMTHLVIQNQLGSYRRMYGEWLCRDTDCGGKRYFSNINVCPKCGAKMGYAELRISGVIPNLAMCMIDGIYRSTEGKYYVVDYKTTSTKYTVTPLLGYLPHKENVAQVEAYCVLVEKKYNIEVSGWLLHYVARDNPFKAYATFSGEMTTRSKQSLLMKIEGYADQFHIAMNATSYKHVQLLVDTKPCKSYKDYERDYSSYEGCPLSSVCFESKTLREELKRAWSFRDDDFLTWRRDKNLAIVKL